MIFMMIVTIMFMELQRLLDTIDRAIKDEDDMFPKSDMDAIRKSSKVYELDRVRRSIQNILNG